MLEALEALNETKGKSFEGIVKAADEQWEKELSKIKINASKDFETKFYTALYRTCLAPVTYSDRDGQYRNHDSAVHQSNGTKYTLTNSGLPLGANLIFNFAVGPSDFGGLFLAGCENLAAKYTS